MENWITFFVASMKLWMHLETDEDTFWQRWVTFNLTCTVYTTEKLDFHKSFKDIDPVTFAEKHDLLVYTIALF